MSLECLSSHSINPLVPDAYYKEHRDKLTFLLIKLKNLVDD